MGNEQSKTPPYELVSNRPNTSRQLSGESQLRSQMSMSLKSRDTPRLFPTVVCAIDFGTSYSGYAYSFLTGDGTESTEIYVNKKWMANTGSAFHKTPTCLMTGPNDEFCFFGYEAESEYQSLDVTKKNGYHLFRQFKMDLVGKDITRHTEIVAVDSKHKMKAMDIFTMSIRYLKDHFLDCLKQQCPSGLDLNMIRWVITVPAIWSDPARHFMREAAYKAGCIKEEKSQNIVIALEPEAASIKGRSIPVNTFSHKSTTEGFTLPNNTEFMTVDAGGGTTDITFHRVVNTYQLEEIFLPSGLPFGSTRIDENFKKLLCDVYGKNFTKDLQEGYPSDYLRLMLKFEMAKIDFSGNKDMCFDLPYLVYQKISGHLNKNPNNPDVLVSNGMLKISKQRALSLVEPIVSDIVDHIGNLLQNQSLEKVSHLLLVGGLGSSPLLVSKLKEVLPSRVQLISPHDAGLAVLKGAVLFGKNEDAIGSRIMRHTYGVAMEPRFKASVHNPDKKVVRGEVAYCADVFQPFVYRGESMKVKERRTKKFFPRVPGQPLMTFDIFYTDKLKGELDDVEYTDSPHFTEVGSFSVMMPKSTGGLGREVETECFLAGTEIKLRAIDFTSYEFEEAEIDSLRD